MFNILAADDTIRTMNCDLIHFQRGFCSGLEDGLK